MKKSALKNREFLVTLTTKRLLAYKRSLMECRTGDWSSNNIELFKSQPEWIENMRILKEILSTRPHESRQ